MTSEKSPQFFETFEKWILGMRGLTTCRSTFTLTSLKVILRLTSDDFTRKCGAVEGRIVKSLTPVKR